MFSKSSLPQKKKSTKKDETPKTSAMRNPVVYVFTVIILLVIVAAFILGPLVGGSAGNNTLVFGTYRGRNIEYTAGSYFTRAYESQYLQAQQQAQQASRQLGIQDVYTAVREAFDSAVFRFGILHMADEAGITVSKAETTEFLANSPRFTDEGGSFSNELLVRTLNNEPGLREETREDILVSKIQNDLVDSGSLSDAEIQFISDMNKVRRIFDIVNFPFEDYPETELEAYLGENRTLFQHREISSITVGTVQEAEQILEQLNSPESSFEDIASANSSDTYATGGGLRGLVWYHDVQRDFEVENSIDSLFTLETGQVSSVFQTRSEQYVIYRADSDTTQPVFTDPAVVEQVSTYMLSFERGRISDYFQDQAANFILSTEEIGWVSAVAEAGISPTTSTAITINYGDLSIFPTLESASSGLLAGASTRESLFTALFSLNLGELTEPVELQDNIVVMRYKEPAFDENSDFLQRYLPFLMQEYLLSEMQRQFASPDNLKDNFDETFQQAFLQEN